jgi:cysteine desulfurase/selenocysteine lyase
MNAPATINPAPYDVEAVRRDFPILQRTVYDKPLVYLDNAASAQKPQVVIDAVTTAYGSEYANVHRGLHWLSNLATEKYEDARETVRRFINADSVEEVIFTRNATEAINLVAASFGGVAIGEGDEIVLSIMEHHSNIVPWQFHRERKGAVIKWAPIADDGTFLLDEFEALLSNRTKIVAITQMSNVTGTVVPIREICRVAHARGIPVLVDGSQGAVHMPVDVQDLDCDFYCMTGHKLYGPTGIGVLYGKTALLKAMPPYMGGGEMIAEVSEDAVTYADPPHRFEAGTPPIVQAIGLGAALAYIEAVGRERIAAHEASLRDYAMERLARINSLTLYGTTSDKGAIVAFNMAGAHPHDISTIIDRAGVAVRAGTHCAQPLLARYGTTATCRASFGMYNTLAEVDSLAEALQKAHEFFA